MTRKATTNKPYTASIWRGPKWTGAQRRDAGRLLQGSNRYLNLALHSLPGFTEADAAVRRLADDLAALGQSETVGSAELVAALADRYQSGEPIDVATEREAFTRAEVAARAQDDFMESYLLVGEELLNRRRAIAYAHDNQPLIFEYLTDQLRALIERVRKAGVTSDTARIAAVSGRDALADVAALTEAVAEFDLLRNAADACLAEFGFRPTDPRLGDVAKLLADTLDIDPFWAVTAAGFRAARSVGGQVVERVTDRVIPDFETEDSATLLAWLAESGAEVRFPSVAEANKAMELLSTAWRQAHACSSRGVRLKFVSFRSPEGYPMRTDVWKPAKPEGWRVVNAETGDEESWTIHTAPQSIIVG